MSVTWGSIRKLTDTEIRAILLGEEEESRSGFKNWTAWDWWIAVGLGGIGCGAVIAVARVFWP